MIIVFDATLQRPACLLLQVALGGDVPCRLLYELFPTKTWLLAPTPDIRRYKSDEESLRKLAALSKPRLEPAPRKKKARRK